MNKSQKSKISKDKQYNVSESSIDKYLTNGRNIDGHIFDLYSIVKNPYEVKEKIKNSKASGYKHHRIITKKRWIEIWVRK